MMNLCLSRVLRCSPQVCNKFISSSALRSSRTYASLENDKPVKFSESPASGWKASLSREGLNKKDISPWFQPYIILASLSAFLIYFCILREESDIDDLLSITLYDRIDGLEKAQLLTCLRYNQENNLPTAAIEKRLFELEQEELRLFGKVKNSA